MREVNTPHDPVAITGIGPMCPGATSVEELRKAPLESEPPEESWFDAPRFLGAKGYKYLTLPTRYLLASTAQAFADARLQDTDYPPERKGVFVGTNFGAHRTLEEMDRVILEEGAEELQPMFAPNFSVNIPASQLSIKHKLQAFNITLTAALVAGIEAVIFGRAAICSGRADLVLAGATEDVPPKVATLIGAPFVSAAACSLTLERASFAERRGARVYAYVGESALLFASPLAPKGGELLADRIDRALERLLPASLEPLPVVLPSGATALGREVSSIVQRSFERRGTVARPVRFPGAGGEYVSASPLLQLAGLASGAGRGLLVTTGPHGHIALLAITGGGAA